MLPAHQCLNPADLFARARHLRLVKDAQAVRLDGLAQVVLDRHAEVQLLLHRLVEKGDAVAPIVFRPVKREVGRLHEHDAFLPILRRKRDTDGERREDVDLAQLEGRRHGILDLARNSDALSDAGNIGHG